MIYSVTAKFDKSKMSEFYKRLTDGTIASQKPDGAEIVSSMNRAKINADNEIIWSEKCYCNPPLKHELDTVYDKYLYDLKIKPIDHYEEYTGESFMQYLQGISK